MESILVRYSSDKTSVYRPRIGCSGKYQDDTVVKAVEFDNNFDIVAYGTIQ